MGSAGCPTIATNHPCTTNHKYTKLSQIVGAPKISHITDILFHLEIFNFSSQSDYIFSYFLTFEMNHFLQETFSVKNIWSRRNNLFLSSLSLDFLEIAFRISSRVAADILLTGGRECFH